MFGKQRVKSQYSSPCRQPAQSRRYNPWLTSRRANMLPAILLNQFQQLPILQVQNPACLALQTSSRTGVSGQLLRRARGARLCSCRPQAGTKFLYRPHVRRNPLPAIRSKDFPTFWVRNGILGPANQGNPERSARHKSPISRLVRATHRLWQQNVPCATSV